MTFDKDKIVFEALRKVLHNKEYRRFGEAFKACSEDLQRIFPSMSQEQQDIVQLYIYPDRCVYRCADHLYRGKPFLNFLQMPAFKTACFPLVQASFWHFEA